MHRTNLYLTVQQERALDSRARRAGITRSALVRRIIDEALSLPEQSAQDLEAAFTELGHDYHRVTAAMFDDDPELRIDR